MGLASLVVPVRPVQAGGFAREYESARLSDKTRLLSFMLALDRCSVYPVIKAGDGYEFSVALPGVRPADLDVSVEGIVLLLKGTARHGSFERRRLPRDADGSASSATFEDGLLSLSVPRAA